MYKPAIPHSFQESELLTIKHMPLRNEIVQIFSKQFIACKFCHACFQRASIVSYLNPVNVSPRLIRQMEKKICKEIVHLVAIDALPAVKIDSSFVKLRIENAICRMFGLQPIEEMKGGFHMIQPSPCYTC